MTKKSPCIGLLWAVYWALGGVSPLQAQTCNGSIADNIPTSRYALHNDGAVSDPKCGRNAVRGKRGLVTGGAGACSGIVSTYF